MSTLITTTRTRDLQSLGLGGQKVAGAWSVLQSVLQQSLGPAHAGLLAEPLTNAVQGETDWYSETADVVRPLASLPPDAQAMVRRTLERLVSEIEGLAATLKASRTADQRLLGGMLELAVRLPDESYIYAAGDRPVLVAWGHSKTGAGAIRVALTAEGAGPARPMAILPPPPSPAPVVRSWGPALLVSTLAALLLLAGVLYLIGRDPMGWYNVASPACTVPPDEGPLRAQLDDAARRESALRLQLAELSTNAGARRLQCAPVQRVAVPPPPPPPRSQDEARALNRGAQRGKLTIILAWDDRNDLDLQVVCPDGAKIFYKSRTACGGSLDVDANQNAMTADVQPVENVYFNQPGAGEYHILVDPYAMRVAAETPFRVTVQQEGRPDRVINGVAHNGVHVQDVATVTVEPGP